MTNSRAYGRQHRRSRASALAKAINLPCPVCGVLMRKGQALDFDHSTPLAVDRNSRADRIVHATCNRREGGQLGSRRARFGPAPRR